MGLDSGHELAASGRPPSQRARDDDGRVLLALWGPRPVVKNHVDLADFLGADFVHGTDLWEVLGWAADMPHYRIVLLWTVTGFERHAIKAALESGETVAWLHSAGPAGRVAAVIGLEELRLSTPGLCVFDRPGLLEVVRTASLLPRESSWTQEEQFTYCLAMNSLPDRRPENLDA